MWGTERWRFNVLQKPHCVLYHYFVFRHAASCWRSTDWGKYSYIIPKLRLRNCYFTLDNILRLVAFLIRAIPFSKAHGGGAEFFWGVPTTTIKFCWPPLPVHFKFNITFKNTLCHPLLPHFDLFSTPYPLITNNFQGPPPR